MKKEKTGYYNLFEMSPVPMWVFDVKTLKFLDANIAAVAHYGFSREEFLAMRTSDIRPKNDVRGTRNVAARNADTSKFYKNAFQHLKKNGELIFVEIESNLIDFNGVKARMVLAHDITEKIVAEQRLEFSEQRFKSLVQEASDLIVIIDLKLNYKYVSPTSFRLLGMHPKEFIGHNALEFIHKDDIETVIAEAEALNTNSQMQFSPFRFKHGDGEWRWLETRATNLIDDKVIKGVVCNAKDITERIENQKQIMENVERYDILSRATRDAIWDCDLQTQKINWNQGIGGILKYKCIGQVTDANWWENNIHPDDRERVVLKRARCIERGAKSWEDEYRFLCGDGIYRYMLDRGHLGFDQLRKPYRMIGAMQDITENKKHVKAIEEQNQKLMDIAWMQSHRVRAPLTKIMSLVSLLMHRCPDDETRILLQYLSQSSAELDEVIASITKNTHKG